MKKALAIVALCIIPLAGCKFTMSENGPVPKGCCQVNRPIGGPDELNVNMDMHDGLDRAVARCLDMGGEPILHPETAKLVCERVDY